MNQISKIKPKDGEYIRLADYGTQGGGICVVGHHKTLEDAIASIGSGGAGEPESIVKLVDFSPNEHDC